jgi:hypothetical protein
MADCGIALIGQDLRRGQDERRRQNVGLSIHAWCLQLRLEIRQIAAIVSSPSSSVACNHGVPKRDNVTVPVGCQRERLRASEKSASEQPGIVGRGSSREVGKAFPGRAQFPAYGR